MGDVEFSWNPAKARSNLKKHGVSFEEATTVFLDEFARLIDDPDHSENEERFIIVGLSSNLRTLTVCHCYRENDAIIRIFSARRATASEREYYGSKVK